MDQVCAVVEDDDALLKAAPLSVPELLDVDSLGDDDEQSSAFADELLSALEEKSPRARTKKRWTRETCTYGEWVRAQDPATLTTSEWDTLQVERKWEAENQAVVAELDALVGFAVVLRKSMRSLYNEADDDEGRAHGRIVYPKGMKLVVVARLGKNLLTQTDMGFYLLVLPRWIKLMPLPTTKPQPEDGADGGT